MFTDTKSTQPCGCDEGANYYCEWHYRESLEEIANRIYAPVEERIMGQVKESAAVVFEGGSKTWTAQPPGETISKDYLDCCGLPTPEVVAELKHMLGLGGAPTRATTLPKGPAERKWIPVASGVLDYFPDAIAAIAHVSWTGNEQHNAGMPLHWDRSKSADESDALIRHFLERGTTDSDGLRHSAKMAWRALALLQKEIEGESK